jgi:hypothetical protein
MISLCCGLVGVSQERRRYYGTDYIATWHLTDELPHDVQSSKVELRPNSIPALMVYAG